MPSHFKGIKTSNDDTVKCIRLFRLQFDKVKRRCVVEIPEVSNTLTPNAGVCDDTPVG